MQGYRVTTDQSEMDFSVIFDFISQSYWAKGIPQATMHKAIDNAFCFAVLQDNGEQVGFARLITIKRPLPIWRTCLFCRSTEAKD